MSAPVHVLPVGDKIEHTLDSECVCGPKIERIDTEHGDEWLITHHSLDGREESE